MRSSNAPLVPTTLIALAMLAGCSGGSNSQMAPTPFAQIPGAAIQSAQQQVTPIGRLNGILGPHRAIVAGQQVTTPSFIDKRAVGKPLGFVSDVFGNAVNIFLQMGKHKIVGQITGLNGPWGLATDSAGNLYVVNDLSSNVAVYAPPYTGAPKLTLDDTGYGPQGVAVSPLGLVGVAACNVSSCASGSGSITIYAQNATSPCVTLAAPATFAGVLNVAFDDKGNLYVQGLGPHSTGGVLGEIKGGCNATKIRSLTTTNTLGYTDGIQVDKADRIAVLDAQHEVMYTYNPPKKGSLGSPVSTTPVTSGQFQSAFAFLSSGHDFYTVAYPGSSGVAYEYDFPVGGTPEKTIAVGGAPEGVAVTPPLVP